MTDDYSTRDPARSAGSPGPHGVAGNADGASVEPRRVPTTRSRLGWLVVAVLCAATTARLGVWQLSRAHQKENAAALVAERSHEPPLPAAALATDAAGAAAQWQRRIELEGRWDAAHTVFLMNRTMDARSGFYVMTPLKLPSGDAVIVQRGWIARDDARPMAAPPVPAPGGTVRVSGHVAPWPSHWIELGKPVPGPVRQNLEPGPFAAEAGLALRPAIVVEDEGPGAPSDGLRRDWPAPDIGTATNYGYAAQWFAMSVAFLGLWAWTQFFRRGAGASSASASDPTDA
ncbi:MAG: SURF1 family protein [Burkholderiaceae bacterium]